MFKKLFNIFSMWKRRKTQQATPDPVRSAPTGSDPSGPAMTATAKQIPVQQKPAERRRFARINASFNIKFKSLEQFEYVFDAMVGDLSLGGMFIRGNQTRPVGTPIEMELPMSGGKIIKVHGIVRSIRYFKGEPAGMGIEFKDLDEQAIDLIQYLIHKKAMK